MSTLRRRRFLQSIAGAPAAAALLSEPLPAQQKPAAADAPKLPTLTVDAVGETVNRFFTPVQFASLRRLSELLFPAPAGMPGTAETKTAEFLDFLIGISPADRKKLYRTGLDGLNLAARKKYAKDFSATDATQADAIVRPLLVAWTYEPPADPMIRFLCEAHDDIRKATMNSTEWAEAANKSAARRRGLSSGLYFNRID